MTPIFVDTSFYLALLSANDAHHRQAVELGRRLRQATLTTEFVLLEIGDALSNVHNRSSFIMLVEELRRDPALTIVPVSSELLAEACDLYRARADKDWSLTDCTSFVAMRREGLTEALTADRHFEQAGFTSLLA